MSEAGIFAPTHLLPLLLAHDAALLWVSLVRVAKDMAASPM
jgi:hypothetical protein